MTFRIHLAVRSYELDSLGHVNHAVYHQYAEVARMKGFQAAGIDWDVLRERDVAAVLLSTTVNFRRELRGDEEIDVTCLAKFGTGKTFEIETEIHKTDGTLSADVRCVVGMMDLSARKLFADPRTVLVDNGFDPAKLG